MYLGMIGQEPCTTRPARMDLAPVSIAMLASLSAVYPGVSLLFQLRNNIKICTVLIRSQDLRRIRRRRRVNLASRSPEGLTLFLLPLCLPLAFVRHIAAIPHHAERKDDHKDDAQHCATGEHPAHRFDLRLGVAIEDDADLVGNLLNL